MKNTKKVITTAVISAFLLFVGLYIYQIEEMTKLSYLLKKGEVERQEIENKTIALEDKADSLLSLSKVEGQINNSNFVKIKQVKYISIPSEYLARRTK